MKLSQEDVKYAYRESQKSIDRLGLAHTRIAAGIAQLRSDPTDSATLKIIQDALNEIGPSNSSLRANVQILCENDALDECTIVEIENEIDTERWKNEPSDFLGEQLRTALRDKQSALEELKLVSHRAKCIEKHAMSEMKKAQMIIQDIQTQLQAKEAEIVSLTSRIGELERQVANKGCQEAPPSPDGEVQSIVRDSLEEPEKQEKEDDKKESDWNGALAVLRQIESIDKAVETDGLAPALDDIASLHQQINEERMKTQRAESDRQKAESRYATSAREIERMKCHLEAIEEELEVLIEEKSSLNQTIDAERIDAKNSIERLEDELVRLRLERVDSGEDPHRRKDDELLLQLRRNKIYPGNCSSAVMVTIGTKTGEWAMNIIKRAMCWSYGHSANGTRSTSREKPFQASVVLFLALGFAYNMYDRKGGVDPAAMDDESGATVREHIQHNIDVLVDEMVRFNVSLGAFDNADALKHDAKKLISSNSIANKMKNLKAAGRNRWRTDPPPNTGDNKRPNIHVEQYEIYNDMQIPFHDESNWSEWTGGQWVTRTR